MSYQFLGDMADSINAKTGDEREYITPITGNGTSIHPKDVMSRLSLA
jgi:hypothetical protein